MINDKEIDEISFMLENSNINDSINRNNDEIDIENIPDNMFILDNHVSYIKGEMKSFHKLNINFYQLWSLLGEFPILQKGHSKYEWRFIRKDLPNVIFRIYDYNNQNNFLNTKTWYLGSTTRSKIHNTEFLTTFLDGIECYNLYYKGIEARDFTNDNQIVHQNLQKIKNELVINRDLLKSL
jgi:hypothetical protein